MKTKSINAIIDPIATTVAQLLVLVEEAEAKKLALPDLREASKIMGEQTENMISLGHESISDNDIPDSLKRKMTSSCNDAKKYKDMLIESSEILAKESKSEKGKKMIATGITGILGSIRDILVCNDDIQVSYITSDCRFAYQNLAKLQEITSPQETVAILKVICERVLQITSRLKKRAEDVTSEELATYLQEIGESLSQETSVLALSCKSCLLNPENLAFIESKKASCENLMGYSLEAEKAIQSLALPGKEEIQIIVESSLPISELDSMSLQFSNADPANAKIALDNFTKASGELTTKGHELNEIIENPKNKERLNAMMNQISELTAKVNGFSEANLADKKRKKMCEDNLGSLLVEIKDFDKSFKSSMIAETVECLDELKDHSNSNSILGQSYNDLINKNGPSEAALNSIDKIVSRLNILGQQVVKSSGNDMQRKKEFLNHLEGLNNSFKEMKSVAPIMDDEKNKNEGKKIFLKIVNGVEDTARKLEEEIFSAGPLFSAQELVGATAKVIDNEIEKASEAIKQGSADDKKVHINRIRHTFQLAKAATSSVDGNVTDVQQKLASIEEDIENMGNATLPQLQNLQSKFSKHYGGIISNIQKQRSEKLNKIEISQVDQAQPSLPTTEEAAKTPVKAACLQALYELSRWDTSQDPLLSSGYDIIMGFMQVASGIISSDPSVRKSWIKANEEITKNLNTFMNNAKTVSKYCTDNRLRGLILAEVDRIPTFMKQLKICLSLYANVDKYNSNEMEEQLYLTVKYLFPSIRNIIDNTEVAFIGNKFKPKEDKELPVKFKKLVYLKAKPQGLSFRKMY